MGMTYTGGTINGRSYSTLEDDFDLYRRRSSNMPFYYIQGICNNECDPDHPGAPEHGYHLVFRTEDDKLVSAVQMPSDTPFGPIDERLVFRLNGEPRRCYRCPIAANRGLNHEAFRAVVEKGRATCPGCAFYDDLGR